LRFITLDKGNDLTDATTSLRFISLLKRFGYEIQTTNQNQLIFRL